MMIDIKTAGATRPGRILRAVSAVLVEISQSVDFLRIIALPLSKQKPNAQLTSCRTEKLTCLLLRQDDKKYR
jgi:hypothetical protein